MLYMFSIWLVKGYHFSKVQPNIEESNIEGAHGFCWALESKFH